MEVVESCCHAMSMLGYDPIILLESSYFQQQTIWSDKPSKNT